MSQKKSRPSFVSEVPDYRSAVIGRIREDIGRPKEYPIDRDEVSAQDVADEMNVSRSYASQIMTKLCKEGKFTSRRVGRKMVFKPVEKWMTNKG